jgi:hypothetical protein
VGSRLRAHMKLLSAEPIDNSGYQMAWEITVEREGAAKPVCIAESLSRGTEGTTGGRSGRFFRQIDIFPASVGHRQLLNT